MCKNRDFAVSLRNQYRHAFLMSFWQLPDRHGWKWCFIYIYIYVFIFLVFSPVPEVVCSWYQEKVLWELFSVLEEQSDKSTVSHIHNTDQIWSKEDILLCYFKNNVNFCIILFTFPDKQCGILYITQFKQLISLFCLCTNIKLICFIYSVCRWQWICAFIQWTPTHLYE